MKDPIWIWAFIPVGLPWVWAATKRISEPKYYAEVSVFLSASLCCVAYFMYGFLQPLMYDFEAKVSFVSDGIDLMVETDGAPEGTITPVNLLLYVQMTNKQDRGVKIERLRFDGRDSSGKWTRLIPISVRNNLLWFPGKDLTKAREYALHNPSLLNILTTRSIPAHGTMAGLFYLQYYRQPRMPIESVRLHVADAEGMEEYHTISLTEKEKPTLGEIGTHQKFGMTLLRVRDISQMNFMTVAPH